MSLRRKAEPNFFGLRALLFQSVFQFFLKRVVSSCGQFLVVKGLNSRPFSSRDPKTARVFSFRGTPAGHFRYAGFSHPDIE